MGYTVVVHGAALNLYFIYMDIYMEWHVTAGPSGHVTPSWELYEMLPVALSKAFGVGLLALPLNHFLPTRRQGDISCRKNPRNELGPHGQELFADYTNNCSIS